MALNSSLGKLNGERGEAEGKEEKGGRDREKNSIKTTGMCLQQEPRITKNRRHFSAIKGNTHKNKVSTFGSALGFTNHAGVGLVVRTPELRLK